MKILHIFSNWKWTGPAEHALNIAAAHLKMGHDVIFACAPPPFEARENSIVATAERAGISPVIVPPAKPNYYPHVRPRVKSLHVASAFCIG